MEIKAVKEEDAEELLSIYAPYVLDTAISFEYEVPSLNEFQERIKRISSDFPYVKAVESGEIIGYAYASKFKDRRAYDWAVETTIYVREDKKRSGVGKMLYNALEDSLKRMGILNMNACIALPKQRDERLSDDSYLFHKEMGFDLVGKFCDCGYKFGKWYDMIWMEKIIGEHTDAPAPVKYGEWTIKP